MAGPRILRRTHEFRWFRVRWLARYGWMVDRAPAVVVVPLAPDGRVWLAEIARPPVARTSWELPGGAIDAGESAVEAGLRELREECALAPRGAVRELPHPLELAPGMGRFPHRVIVAEDVRPVGRRAVGQASEGIGRVRRVSVEDARRLVARGELTVAATLAALAVVGFWSGPLVAANAPAAPRETAVARRRRRGE